MNFRMNLEIPPSFYELNKHKQTVWIQRWSDAWSGAKWIYFSHINKKWISQHAKVNELGDELFAAMLIEACNNALTKSEY